MSSIDDLNQALKEKINTLYQALTKQRKHYLELDRGIMNLGTGE